MNKPNICHQGGIAICGFCGFALIVAGPRECCDQGRAEDHPSPTVTGAGKVCWSARDGFYSPSTRRATAMFRRLTLAPT